LIGPSTLLRSAPVARLRLWFATVVALSAILCTILCAQDDQKRKRDDFLKTRTSSSAEPDESPSPTPKHKGTKKKSAGKKSASSSESKPKAKPSVAAKESEADASSPSPTEKPSPTAKPKTAKHKSTAKKSPPPKSKTKKAKAKETAEPEKTPRPKKAESVTASPTPVARPTAPLPRAIPVTRPAASPEERAQVVVEKSGFAGDQGLEPAPSPPRRSGFWPWSGRSTTTTNYRYLTRSIIEELRRAPVQRRRWQFIVVHNSGTRQGNARVFDYYHRHVRRMQNGLAYHFVIGNGTSTGNGQIEVGDRWRRQINGGHVHSDYLNNISLGICLVGDFNRDQPTRAQLECCEELIRYLRERCGKIDTHEILVRPHREMNPPRWATDCPGDAFPYSWFRRFQ